MRAADNHAAGCVNSPPSASPRGPSVSRETSRYGRQRRCRLSLSNQATLARTRGVSERKVLLTGATGFVGRRLAPVLEGLGWHVVLGTRNSVAMRARSAGHTWVQLDLNEPDDVERALLGCEAAYYLVHSLTEDPSGLFERERRVAEIFALAAERERLGRVIYLGATAPQGPPSEHLRSRLEVGRVLRSGAVPALELRAGMIVGYGSASWRIARDLAARLPAMILPRWLRTRSEPVAIDDVLIALTEAATLPLPKSMSFDLPGPQVMSYREVLERTARLLGHRRVPVVEAPVGSPNLSSQWIRLVTSADWAVSHELVLGLTYDLLARSDQYWQLTEHPPLLSFEQAGRLALEEEDRVRRFEPPAQVLETVVDWVAKGPRSWNI